MSFSATINCQCCTGTDGKVLYRGLTSVYSGHPWDVVECSSCKNIITLPVPTQDLLNDIYSNTYLYPVHRLALGEKKFRSRAMARFVRELNPGKNIFEVGCMYGYLLNELKNDFNVKGIEIGEEAVNYCRDLGLDVQDSSIENYLLNNTEKFDVIILSHVFEHLLSPDKVLEQLRDRLNNGGRIIILVPNSNSFCRKLFGRSWGWWQVPVHINHFRESALRELSKRKGLSIEKVRYKGGDSLMLLLNLINLFNFRSKNSAPGPFQRSVIHFFTFLFRYWYSVGDEEIGVVLSQKSEVKS